jgi:hypothetical protein
MLNHPMALRRLLLADAVASGATGLLVAAAPLSGLLGLPSGLLRGAGLILLPYAALVAWLALRRAEPLRWAVWSVVGVNAVWAADSVLLLLSGWVAPTALGLAFVLAQALVVAGFAVLQAMALQARPALRDAAA